jgi:hypothetical protein
MFDFFKITCGNYLKIIVNVPLKQQLCCNYYTMYIHAIMLHIHISTTNYEIHLQPIFYYDFH